MKKRKVEIRGVEVEIRGVEEALAKVPPEDRDKLRKAIEDHFKDFDFENPPGVEVEKLSDGPTICPSCTHPLTPLTVASPSVRNPEDGKMIKFYECNFCNRHFEQRAKN
jgi:hypothetical protein